MMFKRSLLLAFVLGSASLIYAQETRFFMPSEIADAYKNGTRSFDGKPGPNYWHNTVDYNIEVEVIPEEMLLVGKEDVVYYNNSPDELGQLVIRLYHDVFREANPRAYRVNPSDITEGVEITRLYIGDTEIDVGNPRALRRQGTNMILSLPAPIASGAELKLEIDWMQKIPETTVRTGAYDSTTFFIAYWYPQIAVYDDVFGWDRLSYDFSTEFYNNLGNYDVTITAPEQFSVLATGVLQNPDEILQPEQLARYRQAQSSAETVSILTLQDLESGVRHQSGTWHYQAENVSDFSFCMSDHYGWDAASQMVENRSVLIHTYYNASLEDGASEVTANQRKMMKHFSEDMPG
ncbi:MAG: hypothetical protein R3330_15555, partial [Saprospiraceae bacterium]|nr:hypothetical protein [Saprospiraceae bacterium]